MKRNRIFLATTFSLLTFFSQTACAQSKIKNSGISEMQTTQFYNEKSKISDVINDPDFAGFGRLLFPVDSGYWSGKTLGDFSLVWYSEIKPERTVKIINGLKTRSHNGEKVFFDIYSEDEKKRDSWKHDTGLFFFRGDENAKTAVVNAGGGFAYVGAMHDSFPHAQVLSEKGYNAFALIYRPGAETACEDLSRAVSFLFNHQKELKISMEDYSLWGGSAGARIADWVGTYGTGAFGEKNLPRPAAVIMEYTGFDEVTGSEPPTMAVVGTSDGIVPCQIMQDRINRIKANGTDAKILIFKGLHHGFGLGEGTVAEGWIDEAVKFWERQM